MKSRVQEISPDTNTVRTEDGTEVPLLLGNFSCVILRRLLARHGDVISVCDYFDPHLTSFHVTDLLRVFDRGSWFTTPL